jgi:2-oxoglutarate ferredoxin oxidoreductase subunit beta
LNPLSVTLGIANASFVARTVDWNPAHLHATLHEAYRHRGFSFVVILQRCPTYTSHLYAELQEDPSRMVLLHHEKGMTLDPTMTKVIPNHEEHDPGNLDAARRQADRTDLLPLGILYRDPDRPVYDDHTIQGLDMSVTDKLAGLDRELDRFAV